MGRVNKNLKHGMSIAVDVLKIFMLKKSKGGSGRGKNKLGVENSLVNNINARKKSGTSNSKKDSTVSKRSYEAMERGWKK